MIDSANRARALVVLISCFVAGGVVGVAGDRAFLRRSAEPPRAEIPSPRREERRSPGTEVESDRIPLPLEMLNLSPTEERNLHAIARRWRPRAGIILSQVREQVSDLENDMFAEMLCAISRDKQERYLAQLQENGADAVMIDKRFRLVRSNQCARAGSEAERR